MINMTLNIAGILARTIAMMTTSGMGLPSTGTMSINDNRKDVNKTKIKMKIKRK